VYAPVRRQDLEQRLRRLGWNFVRHGGKHDIWSNGAREEAVPRHREINEWLAAAILRRARLKD
jgi:mRNA interferase HicA